MPIIDDLKLYEKAKEIANEKYTKPSAYRSGYMVKLYKSMGGTYTDDKSPKNLKRWYKEKWEDVSNINDDKHYPVYRPTVKVSSKTPLLPSEISNMDEQIKLKQKIKGDENLKPFIPKDKEQELKKYSNFEKVKEKAKKLGLNPVGISTKKDKKYMIMDNRGHVKHFGQMFNYDFTKTNDENKRKAFRNRNWRWEHADKYSPAFLAYHILWT